MNPFANKSMPLSGPTPDMIPVSPNDSTDLSRVATALYVEVGGAVTFISAAGNQRTVNVPDFGLIQCGVRRVLATGTTASGIHGHVF